MKLCYLKDNSKTRTRAYRQNASDLFSLSFNLLFHSIIFPHFFTLVKVKLRLHYHHYYLLILFLFLFSSSSSFFSSSSSSPPSFSSLLLLLLVSLHLSSSPSASLSRPHDQFQHSVTPLTFVYRGWDSVIGQRYGG